MKNKQQKYEDWGEQKREVNLNRRWDIKDWLANLFERNVKLDIFLHKMSFRQ